MFVWLVCLSLSLFLSLSLSLSVTHSWLTHSVFQWFTLHFPDLFWYFELLDDFCARCWSEKGGLQYIWIPPGVPVFHELGHAVFCSLKHQHKQWMIVNWTKTFHGEFKISQVYKEEGANINRAAWKLKDSTIQLYCEENGVGLLAWLNQTEQCAVLSIVSLQTTMKCTVEQPIWIPGNWISLLQNKYPKLPQW